MLRAGIVDVLGIVNIADIADVADIGTDIADIGMDIADIATGIADVMDSADIADWMLRTLQWKQVDAYKVSRGCPITPSSHPSTDGKLYYNSGLFLNKSINPTSIGL